MIVERFLDGLWLAAGIALAATLCTFTKTTHQSGRRSRWNRCSRNLSLLVGGSPESKEPGAKEGARCIRLRAFRFAMYARTARCRSLTPDVPGCSPFGWHAWLPDPRAMVHHAGLPDRVTALDSAVALLILRLGTTMPKAPANVGSFQFFSLLALRLFGVEKTVAVGFSIVYFISLTIPLWILGLLAIAGTGLSLSTMRWRLPPSRGFSTLLR
jgi:hypothetical protein